MKSLMAIVAIATVMVATLISIGVEAPDPAPFIVWARPVNTSYEIDGDTATLHVMAEFPTCYDDVRVHTTRRDNSVDVALSAARNDRTGVCEVYEVDVLLPGEFIENEQYMVRFYGTAVEEK